MNAIIPVNPRTVVKWQLVPDGKRQLSKNIVS